MFDYLLGAGTFFVLLAINKAIIEPLATAAGRKVLDKYLGPACAMLDAKLEQYGLDFNPENAIRETLDLDPEMSEDDKMKVIEAVFKEWDLRKAAHV